eukprot:TRINITY_DN46581_c0_g1_i1.p1 TRINITY_DN46581_c0_g1~~TRINITY_DN46581_c0_g1_i1.p1  ORF type:complete len:368 (-),score=49.94 TRINITY_DN46581_c0_g1_i1:307-1410(-)
MRPCHWALLNKAFHAAKTRHCSISSTSCRPMTQRCLSTTGTVKRSQFESDGSWPRICIMVHGGAWNIPETHTQANLDACEAAAAAGYALLKDGGAALDAAEAAIRVLEADESLNAGRGCSLNELGEPECDAMLMDGSSLRLGAVAGVQVSHPISLARKVMEKTEHVLMIGQGAMKLAQQELSEESFARENLVTKGAEAEWQQWKDYAGNVKGIFASRDTELSHDTVGCVAFDSKGQVACGTSTGGVVGKLKGRVGDSPLVGSGGYADSEVGAVSTTGHGEAIARVTLARLALWQLESGKTPADAARDALQIMRRRCSEKGGGCGGLIMVSRTGALTASFTTRRMVWASVEGALGHDGTTRRAIDEES